MISSLRVTNLQSHKSTYLEFSPGVNYIIGRSRSGKTSLLRALVKLAQNRPIQGMDRWVPTYNPKGIPDVELVDTDGHCVDWRGGSPQTYTVDGEELSGYGQSVPQAVGDVLRLDDLNISGQHDRPFLLFDTPGEVARTLNRYVRLEAIDKALANIATEERRNKGEVKTQEARLAELQGQAASFPDLEAAGAELDRLEALDLELKGKLIKAAGLKLLQERLAELTASLEALKAPEGMAEALAWLLDKQGELEALASRLAGLEGVQEQLDTLASRTKVLAPGLAQADTVNALLAKELEANAKSERWRGLDRICSDIAELDARLGALAPGLAQSGWITELLTKQKHLEAKRRHIVRLEGLNGEIAAVGKAVGARRAIIGAMEKRIKDEFPLCPLCGQEI